MRENPIERNLLVFSVWAAIGSIGLLLILEGFEQDSYWISLSGIACIVATFVAHIILNAVFGTGFTPGETALGLTSFGVLVFVFVLSVLTAGMSAADFYSGITLFGVLASGFVLYLVTRYGMRGAFSKFHVGAPNVSEAPKSKG